MSDYHLMRGRVRVLLDEGKTDTGTVVEANIGLYPGLLMPVVQPENPEDPTEPRVYNNHIVFAPEMTTEVEIDGTTYVLMTTEAILALNHI